MNEDISAASYCEAQIEKYGSQHPKWRTNAVKGASAEPLRFGTRTKPKQL